MTQGVEHDDGVMGQAHGQRQGLQRGLVVTGLAGGGAIAARPQAQHGALQNAFVSRIKAVLFTMHWHILFTTI